MLPLPDLAWQIHLSPPHPYNRPGERCLGPTQTDENVRVQRAEQRTQARNQPLATEALEDPRSWDASQMAQESLVKERATLKC